MVLVIDNYDSFTYNLVQYIGELGGEVVVHRNDQITAQSAAELNPSGIIFSPGPCTPKESGVCLDVLRDAYAGGPLSRVPIFGVCLGHQAIGFAAGGTVDAAKRILHGKTSRIDHDGKGIFGGLDNPLSVTRYHSLSVLEEGLPDCFTITARTLDDEEIMGLRHNHLPIEGVQFHPESVLTDQGKQMVKNFLDSL